MNKEGLPLTECCKCAKLNTCPIPSDEPDARLCFIPIKQEALWKEEK